MGGYAFYLGVLFAYLILLTLTVALAVVPTFIVALPIIATVLSGLISTSAVLMHVYKDNDVFRGCFLAGALLTLGFYVSSFLGAAFVAIMTGLPPQVKIPVSTWGQCLFGNNK